MVAPPRAAQIPNLGDDGPMSLLMTMVMRLVMMMRRMSRMMIKARWLVSGRAT